VSDCGGIRLATYIDLGVVASSFSRFYSYSLVSPYSRDLQVYFTDEGGRGFFACAHRRLLHVFTPRSQSHGHFVGCCDHDRGRTRPRLTQTRRRTPRVGPVWGRTGFLIRHAPGPDWHRNCPTGAWDGQARRLARSWHGPPRWYNAPTVAS